MDRGGYWGKGLTRGRKRLGGASGSGIKAQEEDTRGKDPGCGGEREKRQHRGAGEMSRFRAPAQAHSRGWKVGAPNLQPAEGLRGGEGGGPES